MINDLTIEILALKCNSQDLFTAKLVASKNQMISGDKKHTTIIGKTRTTNKRKSKKVGVVGLGIGHGDGEGKRIYEAFSIEAPTIMANTKYREFHHTLTP